MTKPEALIFAALLMSCAAIGVIALLLAGATS
jgi:hypothetical protein